MPKSLGPWAWVRAFLSKVTVQPDGCWTWTGSISPGGYGLVSQDGRLRPAHRAYYEFDRGPITDGLTLDHLCRDRSCVNPAHLEPVTNRTNVLRGVGITAANARKTHCKRGHPFDEANTIRKPLGRGCRACKHIVEANRPPRRRVAEGVI